MSSFDKITLPHHTTYNCSNKFITGDSKVVIMGMADFAEEHNEKKEI